MKYAAHYNQHNLAAKKSSPQRKQAQERATRRLQNETKPSRPLQSEDINGYPSLKRAFFGLLVAGSAFFIGRAFLGSSAVSSLISNSTNAQATALANDPTITAKRIGIVSGHRNNDSGTVCADGYTESQLTYDVSLRAATLLRARGYIVEILDEFDTRLSNYKSAAFISIHADSCQPINALATGFKVARGEQSSITQKDDQLVACMTARYKTSTKLSFNANTITENMTQYHAFNKIAKTTPSAIIEVGFLYLDRATLTKNQDQVAQGVVDGIICFLNNETP